jgi:hypothetical protein
MISRKQIASIKMAQKDAGIADEQYRQILFQVAGVTSCKDLDSSQVVDVMNAMNAIREYNADETSALPGKKKKGWQPKQIRTWKKYVRYCKMSDLDAAQLLYKATGYSDVESGKLTQIHFDIAMAAIEVRTTDGGTPLPAGIDPHYWRNKRPKRGKANSREIWEIKQKWTELEQLLSPEHRNDEYLLGICAHACRYAEHKPLEEMTSRDALKAVEALKKRIIQCERKLEAAPF